jgi:hypothetical protein
MIRLALPLLLQGAAFSAAAASCGDWLAHEPNSRLPSETGWTISPPAPATAPQATRADGASGRHLPPSCTGAHCHSSPFPPSSPAPIDTFSRSGEKVALALAVAQRDFAERPSRLVEDSAVHPTKGYVPRVEHPPRG